MAKQSKAELKKQIRNTQRLLKKKQQTLTAIQLTEMTRKLEYLEIELAATETNSVEVKMHQKYKMVKFIEMKKCARKVKQITHLIELKEGNTTEPKRDVDDADDFAYTQMTMDELKAEIKLEQDNVNYITHYPKDFKYISLFTIDHKSIKKVLEIKAFISKMVSEGTIRSLSEKDLDTTTNAPDSKPIELPIEEEKDDFFM